MRYQVQEDYTAKRQNLGKWNSVQSTKLLIQTTPRVKNTGRSILAPNFGKCRPIIMSPPLIGGGIKRCFCLTLSVAYIGPNSRTEKPRKTKIATEVAHVTRDSNITFKIRSKVRVTRPLWLVVLAGQHGHTVMVTYPCAYMTYISCHHLQAWVGAYRGGHPPTACQNYFTIGLSSDRVTKWSLKIPPHLKRVATLPCKTLLFENYCSN